MLKKKRINKSYECVLDYMLIFRDSQDSFIVFNFPSTQCPRESEWMETCLTMTNYANLTAEPPCPKLRLEGGSLIVRSLRPVTKLPSLTNHQPVTRNLVIHPVLRTKYVLNIT